MKSHRATLIRVLTDIAQNTDNTTAQRLEAIKLAVVLKSRQSRTALARIDKAIAQLIGNVDSASKPDANSG